jgi:hypothetical protein
MRLLYNRLIVGYSMISKYIHSKPVSTRIFLMVLICCTFSLRSFGQLAAIPDANFRQCLKENYPQMFEGELIIIDSAKKIKNVLCTGKEIETIEGVEYFINADVLDLRGNKLTLIPDISMLKELRWLSLGRNNLNVLPDLAGNVKLEVLFLSENHFTVFPDIPSNINVEYIAIEFNDLTNIPDLSHIPKLKWLYIGYNPLETLSSLENCTALRILGIGSTKLTTFPDLSKNTELTSLSFHENPQFSSWPDITANTKLQEIGCRGNNHGTIPSLSIYPDLRSFGCEENNLSALPNMSACTNLEKLSCSINNLTSMPDLSHTKLGKHTGNSLLYLFNNHFTFEDLMPFYGQENFGYYPQQPLVENITIEKAIGETLTLTLGFDEAMTENTYRWYHNNVEIATTGSNTLTINNLKLGDAGNYTCKITNAFFPLLTLEWGQAQLTLKPRIFIQDVNFRACLKESYPLIFEGDLIIADSAKNIKNIECYNKGIGSIEGIENFISVTNLNFTYNQITTIPDLSKLTDLIVCAFSANEITTFPDLSNNAKIQEIHFAQNQLTTLPNLQNNTDLRYLILIENKITSIPDLSHLTQLSWLTINSNPVTTMGSLAGNLWLRALDISNTKLASFPDLSQNVELRELHFGQNPQFLTWPNITANIQLTTIGCVYNNLSFIPSLAIYPQLKTLHCAYNKLNSLPDLSMLTELEQLDCHGNNLTSLPDLSNTKLGDSPELNNFLNISENHLTFEDLIPVIISKSYFFLSYEQQTIPNQNIFVNKKQGEDFAYDLDIDDLLTNNTYAWYHDGVEIIPASNADSHKNILYLSNLKSSDAGSYTCVITNSSIPDLTLEWKQFHLSVDNTSPGVKIDENPVFSPNNDGVADNFHIPYQGIAMIFDRNGVLINELPVPGDWDGTDQSGAPAPMGTYVITVDGQKEIFITIVR